MRPQLPSHQAAFSRAPAQDSFQKPQSGSKQAHGTGCCRDTAQVTETGRCTCMQHARTIILPHFCQRSSPLVRSRMQQAKRGMCGGGPLWHCCCSSLTGRQCSGYDTQLCASSVPVRWDRSGWALAGLPCTAPGKTCGYGSCCLCSGAGSASVPSSGSCCPGHRRCTLSSLSLHWHCTCSRALLLFWFL